jgi:hypothetical protein
MEHAMVRAAEAQFRQHVVGVADEIPISEKQKLDDVPDGFMAASRSVGAGK